jgi:hypothetical protein
MFEIVQAPNETTSQGIELFLAGGISNCPNWQNEIVEKLINDPRFDEYKDSNQKIIVFNPRCKEIPEENPQIIWEYKKLKSANIISFWFSFGSFNPITLFEYGSHLKSTKDIIVGCHPEYVRKNNVVLQTKLERPDITVNETFENFYEEIVNTLINKIKNEEIIPDIYSKDFQKYLTHQVNQIQDQLVKLKNLGIDFEEKLNEE